jgi:hypothetical protein
MATDSTSSTQTGDQVVPEAQGPEAFVIPAALAQATLNYLAAQPYREVFTLIQGFESLEPLSLPGEGSNGTA